MNPRSSTSMPATGAMPSGALSSASTGTVPRRATEAAASRSAFARWVEQQRHDAMQRLRVDTDWGDRETWLGCAQDLFDAGVLSAQHLAEMSSRSTRRITIGPDGRPLPARAEVPWHEGGYVRINVLRDDEIYVERSLSPATRLEQWRERVRDAAAGQGSGDWRGSRAELIACGMPASWFDDLPRAGCSWGQRSVSFEGRTLDVWVTRTGYRVRVQAAAAGADPGAMAAPAAMAGQAVMTAPAAMAGTVAAVRRDVTPAAPRLRVIAGGR